MGSGDADRFKERAQVMVDFFNKIEVLPGLQANGELTLGENLADHGGLNVAYLAFQNATKDAPLGVVDGFTWNSVSSWLMLLCGLVTSATNRFVCTLSQILTHWVNGV